MTATWQGDNHADHLAKVLLEFNDTWAKVSGFREAAVRAARLDEAQIAKRLFRQAIEEHATG